MSHFPQPQIDFSAAVDFANETHCGKISILVPKFQFQLKLTSEIISLYFEVFWQVFWH